MIVIIGVLAAFGVPKFLASVEKSKAAEAFNFWSAVQSAEERFLAQSGVYCTYTTLPATLTSDTLDIILPTLQYFSFAGLAPTNSGDSGTPTWNGTLIRLSGSSSYGSYTVEWNDQGFNTASSISSFQAICPVSIAGS